MPNRQNIYYWKSDRPSAFVTLQSFQSAEVTEQLIRLLTAELQSNFDPCVVNVKRASGQGNHATFTADCNGKKLFIRLEDGPEKDNYMLAEERVIEMVREKGVPTVHLYKTDASRKNVRFAYQVMDFLPYQDLNSLYKSKEIDLNKAAYEIGKYIGRLQEIRPVGFGPFNTETILHGGGLQGLHADYPAYYYLNLDEHLSFLAENEFISAEQAADIRRVIDGHENYLQLDHGFLVHKDMALWNILGTNESIKAIIDWDDTISGDPTDDLSLLACFHDEPVLKAAVRGYTAIRPLPEHFNTRFHLHLLRNMIVKAVIRVGGNYFKKTDDFFLIDTGEEGSSLEKFTRDRIFDALENLRNKQYQPII